MRWKLDEAAAKSGEIFKAAIENGPQILMEGRKEIVIVVSREEYERRRQAGYDLPAL